MSKQNNSIFTSPHPLNTAVLFLVFNRLDTTKQVFHEISQAKPPRLYIAADAARANNINEVKKVHEVRNYIMQNINWECEIKTLFRDQNLGCKYAVTNAISWFFENEEQGIVLEDDCLPSQSFFWYCEELLTKYKDDKSVYLVSGETLALTGSGSVASANVGNSKSVTLGSLTLGNNSGTASNYSLSSATFDIEKRPLNISSTRAYDGTTSVSSSNISYQVGRSSESIFKICLPLQLLDKK